MAQFKSAFFAFPREPAELRNPIATAVELVKSNLSLSLQAWPQLQIFGAAIPDEVRGGIEKANVLVCDITKPNLNVYYETGYGIGLGKSLAPVLNASFAHATADIQKDGLFDIIGYNAYENSHGLAAILGDLPSTVLVDLYGKPLNTHQPIFFLNSYRDKVNGRDTFDYLVDHCLMRPRFLIAIIETAIANAINRGHEKVSEHDCTDAVKQHSNSILNDFGYEIRGVLHSLAGATEYITKAEVLERFERANIIAPKEGEKCSITCSGTGCSAS